MHPAKSVIAFTTTSGAGYGLLVWLAVAAQLMPIEADMWFGITAFGVAFGLVSFGLLASTFHLGHPERAWRAFSQWRSSWLSREGVMAVFTFVPTGVFALYWVFQGVNTGDAGVIGVAGAVCSLITVYCTAMIYGSLKAIPAWHNKLTPLIYLSFSLATGGVLFILLTRIWGYNAADAATNYTAELIIISVFLKALYWSRVKNNAPISTAESATGLGHIGKVSLFEAPHHGDNYLLKEMGFKVARKHAHKLKLIFSACFVLVFALLVFAEHSAFIAIAATAAMIVGVIAERWLFFAEAKHAVTLYYGESEV